jgi:hypothetical protein
VTELFEFTTDIQLHFKPARDRGRDVAAVGSLRAIIIRLQAEKPGNRLAGRLS